MCPRCKGYPSVCQGCTRAVYIAFTNPQWRLRHLLVRGQLRDLCCHFLRFLPSNTGNQVVCILQRELCDLHSTLDRKYLLGIPARIYYQCWAG